VADPGEHVLLTGPITGTVTTTDGTVVDVTQPAVVVPADQVDEVAHLVGLRYAAEGHPDDPPDEPFQYEVPKTFVKYEPHPDNSTIVATEES